MRVANDTVLDLNKPQFLSNSDKKQSFVDYLALKLANIPRIEIMLTAWSLTQLFWLQRNTWCVTVVELITTVLLNQEVTLTQIDYPFEEYQEDLWALSSVMQLLIHF